MNTPQPRSGARDAAEEIVPMPLLPRVFGGRSLARQVEGRRQNVERIISSYCIDRSLGLRALHALDAEARRLALSGRTVPADLAEAITALENALTHP